MKAKMSICVVSKKVTFVVKWTRHTRKKTNSNKNKGKAMIDWLRLWLPTKTIL